MPTSNSLVYLGAVMGEDGRSESEVSWKLGQAEGDFRALSRVWSHTNVGVADKLRYSHAIVISRLLYSLSSLWLVTAQHRRLDGFYARCSRKILRVPPAYHSRVSNTVVFDKAGTGVLSEQSLFKQLVLLGKVARSPLEIPLRIDTFVDNSLRPQIGRYVR